MNILKKELVAKNSSAWVGFQHAVLSTVSSFIFSSMLVFGWPDFFGFFYQTGLQATMTYALGLLLGTLLSGEILFRIFNKAENPQGMLKASVIWFSVAPITLSLFLIVAGGLLDTLVLLVMVLEFALFSSLFLAEKVGKVQILLTVILVVALIAGFNYSYRHYSGSASNWPYYISASRHLSFKYPADWHVAESGEYISILPSSGYNIRDTVTITYFNSLPRTSPQAPVYSGRQWNNLREALSFELTDIRPIEVLGEVGYEGTFTNPAIDLIEKQIWLEHSGHVYMISHSMRSMYEADRIIESLTWTK